jgi:glycosyltransferase involved in cell wall biosynthesis
VIRIGIICNTGIGGSATVACELARQLGARGHRVHVIGRSRPRRLDPDPVNVRFHAVSPLPLPVANERFPTLEFAAAIARISLEEDLDLLHAHYSVPHAISAQLAREMVRSHRPLPVITTLHGTDVTTLGGDPALHAVARLAITGSDAVTAVSRSLAEAAATLFQLPRVSVIPNFIDASPWPPAEDDRKPPGSPIARREAVLVHVSNFRPVKRATDCIRILDLLRHRHPCRLLMVGQGPDLPAARELAVRLGLASSVDFVGERHDVASCLAAADILLLPSQTEAFGMAALEAMAAGLPVVASNAGGLPEVIEDGITGRLLPVGDLRAMADAVVEVLEEPELANTLAENGRRRALSLFSPVHVVPRYLELYEQTLNRFRNPPPIG